MTQEILRLEELESYLTSIGLNESFHVSGCIRTPELDTANLIPILQIGPRLGTTLLFIFPAAPDVTATGAAISRTQFENPEKLNPQKCEAAWWGGWKSTLVALGVVAPHADPQVLFSVLTETKRIRLVCDTNALAGGVACWLLGAKWNSADLVVSAVVDRELHGWPDRFKNAFWTGSHPEAWQYRTCLRIARTTLETTPDGVVVERMAAPEQSALMLSKVGDSKGQKSPDADILMIEHARSLIQQQARNARTVYLTGDLNNARAAVNSLGPDNVLYAVADSNLAKAYHNKPVTRGWWSPQGPLGSIFNLDLGTFFFRLLAPLELLVLENDDTRCFLRIANSLRYGCPSDWVNPHFELNWESKPKITSLAPPDPAPSVQPVPGATTNSEISKETEKESKPETSISEAVRIADTIKRAEESARSTGRGPLRAAWERAHLDTPNLLTNRIEGWLLPKLRDEDPLDIAKRNRLSPKATFYILSKAYGLYSRIEPPSPELLQEAVLVLSSLGAVTGDQPGPRWREWSRAFATNNLDWIHHQFLRHPGYSEPMQSLRTNDGIHLAKRASTNVAMASDLAQVATLPGRGKFLGDAPLDVESLVRFLTDLLPNSGDSVTVAQATRGAAESLSLTPYRFDLACSELWKQYPGVPFVPETGGSVSNKISEKVVHFGRLGVDYRNVYWEALSFGTAKTFRFIRRI